MTNKTFWKLVILNLLLLIGISLLTMGCQKDTIQKDTSIGKYRLMESNSIAYQKSIDIICDTFWNSFDKTDTDDFIKLQYAIASGSIDNVNIKYKDRF